jgi:hypothetical protein
MQAKAIAPDSPEPEQALASLQYELGNSAGALQTLKTSMKKWWRPEAMDGKIALPGNGDRLGSAEETSEGLVATRRCDDRAQVLPEGADAPPGTEATQDEDAHEAGGDGLPSYEFRLECCKLLIELDESTDTAIEVRSAA